jgi:hypothetical protein
MQRIVDLSAADAFALVADFSAHERWIPLTTISTPGRPLVEGDEVVACSARILDDRMRIVELSPPDGLLPGVLRVEKLGPVLLGEATITVVPSGPDHAVVRWEEDVWLAGPIPKRITRPLLAPALTAMLEVALRSLQRDATSLATVRDRRRAELAERVTEGAGAPSA